MATDQSSALVDGLSELVGEAGVGRGHEVVSRDPARRGASVAAGQRVDDHAVGQLDFTALVESLNRRYRSMAGTETALSRDGGDAGRRLMILAAMPPTPVSGCGPCDIHVVFCHRLDMPLRSSVIPCTRFALLGNSNYCRNFDSSNHDSLAPYFAVTKQPVVCWRVVG